MKNISPKCKDTALVSVLHGHFEGEGNLARVKLICLFITALFKTKMIHYDNLASGFATKPGKNEIIGEQTLADTILNRLIHNAHRKRVSGT